MVTLRFLAKGDFYSELADILGILKSSACHSVWNVRDSILKRLHNVTFPKSQVDIQTTKEQFYRIAHLPNVIGAIDGTLIPIQAPSENEHIYICHGGGGDKSVSPQLQKVDLP